MSEFAREILIGTIGTVIGSLLGSLGTIAVFRGEIIGLARGSIAMAKDIERVERVAAKAGDDANKAWSRFRELKIVVKERTEEHPRYESRDSGEGPAQS